MRNIFSSVRGIFRHNLPEIIIFEFIYRFLTVLFYWWLCGALISVAMDAAGYSYITVQNLPRFLTKPATIPVLLVLAFVGIILLCYESSVLMTGFQASAGGYKLSLVRLVTFGTRSFLQKLRSPSCPVLLLSSPVFCGISLTLIYRLLVRVRIFSPFVKKLFVNSLPNAALAVGLFLLALITIPCIHLLFCVFYENKSLKGSGAHGRKSILIFLAVSLVYTAAANAVGYGLYRLLYFVFVFLSALLTSAFKSGGYVYSYMLEISQILDIFMLFAGSILTMVLNIGILSGVFFRYRKNAALSIPDYTNYKKPHPRRAAVFYFIVFAVFSVCAVNTVIQYRNGKGLETYIQDTYITAHRGYSARAPENTIPAIQLAADSLADMAEIDVQLTSDGEIVLCHDASLKRTAGTNVRVGSLTLEAVQSYDVGAYYGDAFAGTYIPTLAQVFDEFAGKLRFEIELKNYTGNEELPQKVVALIQEYGLEGQCVIASTSYSFLKQVRELDPRLPTGYILSSIYGQYYADENIDFFSASSSFLDASTVNAMHLNGKEVHAWTVNNRSEMIRLLNLGVDNIITDVPLYAREVIFSEDDTVSFMDIIRLAVR